MGIDCDRGGHLHQRLGEERFVRCYVQPKGKLLLARLISRIERSGNRSLRASDQDLPLLEILDSGVGFRYASNG